MKKIIFITLCLIPLITGCDNKMDLINKHITNLSKSTDSAVEKNNATTLNDFSLDNYVTYSLEITKNNSTPIKISDLDNSMDEKLKVIIKTNDLSETWAPIDNKNIYILLRE